ncbi:HGGxSTG domain-containing protein [Novosphingobium aquimarinum]|uniref:HGGxSTG domain-containing protein n=1 Tax=Novosphingobium aquimarinum TaxID=2682494 RepID=UPI0038CD28AC
MNGEPPLLTTAPLCQARNRTGKPCRCPAIKGKLRCRLHGGANRSGAPNGVRWCRFSGQGVKLLPT